MSVDRESPAETHVNQVNTNISQQEKNLKVAIVHYWLVTMRGGEKVVEQLCEIYPQADIYTLVLDESKISPKLKRHKIITSFLQKIPGIKKHYTKLLPIMPFAVESFDLQSYDLVISSESGPAKAIVARPDAVHICYCHSPMRYLWDQYHVYRRDLGMIGRMIMSMSVPLLRVWDVTTSSRVDAFIANSANVARRIKRVYGRESTVIYPPVSVEDFSISANRGDFYLLAGQLVTYKRADLAVSAFTKMGKRLVVLGEGPQLKLLKKIAGPNIEFLGYQPFPVLKDHLARCKALVFPGEEDFGILPVEAMASGRPVIAYDAGGARETVSNSAVGVKFSQQTEEDLIAAVERFEEIEASFDPSFLRSHAETFAATLFRDRMKSFVDRELAKRNEKHSPALIADEQSNR